LEKLGAKQPTFGKAWKKGLEGASIPPRLLYKNRRLSMRAIRTGKSRIPGKGSSAANAADRGDAQYWLGERAPLTIC
jgi:hypothetical protein